jgi:lauroyl/myristoyl acyltransferase
VNPLSEVGVGSTSLAHRLEFGLFRGLRRFVDWVPERAASRSAGFLGLVAGSVLRIRRSAVDRHLALAFPDSDRRARARVARESYRHLGREAVVLFRMGAWSMASTNSAVRWRAAVRSS